MILRHADALWEPRPHPEMGALDQRRLSGPGGLTQFGAHVEVLHPGARSSDRHWHAVEDEMLYMLDGEATVIDDSGPWAIRAGEHVCWPAGVANAHHLVNQGTAACTWLIVGTRAKGEVVHYPDLGTTLRHLERTWRVEDAAGRVVRGGDLWPDEMSNRSLPFPEQDRAPGLRVAPADPVAEADPQHPVLGGGLGPYAHAVIGDPGGLTQFGAHLEILPPGSRSSFRHWHETEDEMVYVLSGAPTLIEKTETGLGPGDAVCWPAGQPVAHCLENRSGRMARYLTIGTRNRIDTIHYPDHDLITHKDGPARRYLRGDGTPHQRTLP